MWTGIARDPKSRGVKRQFHKMHGLGNDFVILDARSQPIAMTPAVARAIADRRTGIGCDQLILLEESDRAELRMDIWNADGGKAEACGNASRCVVALTGAGTIETAGGVIQGASDGDEVEVAIGEPRFGWDAIPLAYPMDTAALPMGWDELEQPIAVNVGNPHLVFFVDAVDEERLGALGPAIEHDAAFPERIYVHVATVTADGLELRTWEPPPPHTHPTPTPPTPTPQPPIVQKKVISPVRVAMKGGALTIAWAPGEPIVMRGSATHVFSGDIDLEALA
jgi:diaminopimelate epimerase